MTGCQSCDEFLIEYLLALQELKAARQQLAYAATLEEWEAARARLARVSTYKEHATQEMAAHCHDTGCEPPDLGQPILDQITH
jgi:tartrate dehydratase alpha subunit/fumarate hydratase class I-like protein